MKKVIFLGFTAMQIELARKFVAYRGLAAEVQVLPEEHASGEVDAYVVNGDDAAASGRLTHLLRTSPKPSVGVGSAAVAGVSAFVAGPFKPATADALVALLRQSGSITTPANQHATGTRAPFVLPPTTTTTTTTTTTPPTTPQPAPVQTANVVSFPAAAGVQPAAVLVVDDSDMVRKTMVRKINEYGHRVDVANDGAEALAMIQGNRYKLVFLDVMMPGIDGFEVCKRIKKSPEYKSTAVFMLSSKDGMFDKVRGSMAGCNGYLVKPLESAHLRAVLDKFFDRRAVEASKAVPGGRREEDMLALAARNAKQGVASDFTESVAAPRSRLSGEADSRLPAFADTKGEGKTKPGEDEFPRTAPAQLQDRPRLAS